MQFGYPTIEKRNTPSRGEKPPLRINSKSQSCLSVKTIAGSFSASAASWSCLCASRARRSLVNSQHKAQSGMGLDVGY
jgi:hypothetical protein